MNMDARAGRGGAQHIEHGGAAQQHSAQRGAARSLRLHCVAKGVQAHPGERETGMPAGERARKPRAPTRCDRRQQRAVPSF